MNKLFSLLILAALVLAACGGGSDEVAATIDETSEITVGDVEGLIDPGEESVIAKDRFAQVLGFQIQLIITEEAAAEEFDISIAEGEIAAEADSIVTTNAGPDMSREEFLASSFITEQALLEVARQQLIIAEVERALESQLEEPAQEDIDAQMESAVENLFEVCARHILVATEEEAQEAIDSIDGGEAFEDLAVELSLDPGSGEQGGDLGCSSPTRYVPEFAETTRSAEIGEVSDPVETEFGFHIILVYDRNEPAEEDLPAEQDIIDQLKAVSLGQVVNDWFLDKMGEVTVVVNEKYGTWQVVPQPGVVPPAE